MRINKPIAALLRPSRVERLLIARYPGVWPGLIEMATSDYEGAARAVATSVLGPLSGRILSGEFGAPFNDEDDENIDLLSDVETHQPPTGQIPDAAVRAARAFLDQVLTDYKKLEQASDAEIERQASQLPTTAKRVEVSGVSDDAVSDDARVDARYLNTLHIVLRACLIDGYGYRDDGSEDAKAHNSSIRKEIFSAIGEGDRQFRAVSRAITNAIVKGRQ